jgi:hypothetical protein
METTTISPIEYPKITLDGKSYEVKFRVGDIIRLKKDHGIDISIKLDLKGIEAFSTGIQMLSAGLAHEVQFSVDQLADMIPLAEFPTVLQAVTQALAKATPQAVTTPSPTPIQ